MATAVELLQKIRSGARYGNIRVSDVEEILSSELFTSNQGLLATTENGQSTLLHLAAQTSGDNVLPLVCQAYKRAKLFREAMTMLNSTGKNPLHVAIVACRFENTVILFKESLEHCPEALQPNQDGWTLLHHASGSAENLNIVKYLLSQDVCRAMVLTKGVAPRRKWPSLPQDIAGDLVVQSEFYVKTALQHCETFTAKMSGFARDSHIRTTVDPKKKVVEKAKELYAHINQVTLELKAEEAERMAKELERTKVLEREQHLGKEMEELLQDNKWESVVAKYLLSDSEETRKITVLFLVNKLQSGDQTFTLPTLSVEILKTLAPLLFMWDEDSSVLSSLRLIEGFTKSPDSVAVILDSKDMEILPRLVYLLSSLDTSVQAVTVSVIFNMVNCERFTIDEFPEQSVLVEALQLLKHFSLSQHVQSLATNILESLCVGQTHPDPGSWSVRQVSLWLDGIAEFDQRSEYIQRFKGADINGLHLLELSVSEMAGLGVKFVSHQRKLSDKIDELRRMNVRSVVGQKDIFLSYAHININFARRIKSVLNNAQYSVWIDEAGIRAGQKWRNEIADGVQGCGVFVFLLSNRSANSQYCQNEVALAEMYHKPIVTVKVESIAEVDPGLQFMIGRRQWLDFSDEVMFPDRSSSLVQTVVDYIGAGRGTESDESPVPPPLEHKPDQPTENAREVVLSPGLFESELDKLKLTMETQLAGVCERLEQLETKLNTFDTRLSALEQNKKTAD